MKTTFVWYPFMPIACEGNDDDEMSKSFILSVSKDSVQNIIDIIEKRYGGYVQVWSQE